MRFSKKQSVERHFLKIHGSGKEQMFKKIAEEIESNSEFYPVEYVHIGEEIKTENSVGTSQYNAGKSFMIFDFTAIPVRNGTLSKRSILK